MSNETCDRIEMLISAELDGELTFAESDEVKNHMAKCESCSRKQSVFQEINGLVSSLGQVDGATVTQTGSISRPSAVSRGSDRNYAGWMWSVVPFGIALSLMIGIGIATWPAPEGTTRASEISDPMIEVMKIYEQSEIDQRLMLRTLEVELRSLRLELAQVDVVGDDGEQLDNRLDQLIQQVRQFELNGHSEQFGEK